MRVSLSAPEGKHWPCLQSLSQTSGHSLSDGSKGAHGQSEDEAETVSAMASLSVDVEQQTPLVNSTESGRSATLHNLTGATRNGFVQSDLCRDDRHMTHKWSILQYLYCLCI